MVAGFAVLAASIAAGAVVVRHLNRPVPLERGAESDFERVALAGRRAPMSIARSQPAALTAGQVHVITDAAESRVAVERKL
jgi:negative regulator of sigma E activity